jgi:hypothetical protein
MAAEISQAVPAMCKKATAANAVKEKRFMRPNETEISHGRVSWQTRWTHFEMGPLASSVG